MTVIVIGGSCLSPASSTWRAQRSGAGSSAIRMRSFSGPMPGLEAQGFTASGPTLEPSRRGLRFLGITANWPGLLMLAAGAVLLLSAVV